MKRGAELPPEIRENGIETFDRGRPGECTSSPKRVAPLGGLRRGLGHWLFDKDMVAPPAEIGAQGRNG